MRLGLSDVWEQVNMRRSIKKGLWMKEHRWQRERKGTDLKGWKGWVIISLSDLCIPSAERVTESERKRREKEREKDHHRWRWMERQRGERGAVVRMSPWADVVWGQREGSAACLCAVLLPIEIMKGGALGKMCSHHSLSVCHQSSALCHPSPFSSSGPRRPCHCHHGHYLTQHTLSLHTHKHTWIQACRCKHTQIFSYCFFILLYYYNTWVSIPITGENKNTNKRSQSSQF